MLEDQTQRNARLFGYSKVSLLLPEALAGTAAVVILYVGVRSAWGRGAGLIAALALALTPINVMVNHSNNTDATLVFLMVLGAARAIVCGHVASVAAGRTAVPFVDRRAVANQRTRIREPVRRGWRPARRARRSSRGRRRRRR